ncbi:gallate 1-beta-glucosyltransferase 84A24-like [Malania oleifera]|uniref:gallate 1-beta-glucosyltransferase 84A24-like n=1 Tax=Malania oleifera TaxID=397392 RepID=UPI0025AE80C3|nr:gallate 1-beta-glucosyltransferase 84A24-like [Malania oleifera]
MRSEPLVHVFMVSFPAQGHVNPLLRLGKRLASKGLLVTFSTTETIGKYMREANNITDDGRPIPLGAGHIRFQFFDESLAEDDPRLHNLDHYLTHLELVGRHHLPRMLAQNAQQNRPVSCLINNPFIPWVSDVAHELRIPNALLWVQSCAAFSCYYHYYHGLVPFPSDTEPETDVKLPCMPLLKNDEVPSFLHPSTPYPFMRRVVLGQFKNLSIPFCVLMDTFRDLEDEIIEQVSRFAPVKPVGPLFKSPTAGAVRGDLMKADDCVGWLDSKPKLSVVYLSFGSAVYLKQEQIDEIAFGLLDSGVSFLWVMKPPNKVFGHEAHVFPEGFLEMAGEKGKVVQWSPQEQVLVHPSVACFLTHCGWNSSMEALASGVQVVAFPQWGDQVTDAKFLVDVFGVGVRMCRGEAEKKLITREEVKKCLVEATAGPKAAEMKENAMKWKEAAEGAVAEGGSSYRNLEEFVEEVKRMSVEVIHGEVNREWHHKWRSGQESR